VGGGGGNRRRPAPLIAFIGGGGEVEVALQLFALHIYAVLFLVPLSPFLHSAVEASFDIKKARGKPYTMTVIIL
jgi:hypothetical protein